MAGGPYTTNDGWKYIKWSDKKGHPEQPKKTESLKTKKNKIAALRKAKLESLYQENKHDPWILPWHKNTDIRPLIVGNMFDNNIDIQNIRPPANNYVPSLTEAAELYISYKTPPGDRKTEKYQWSPQTNAPKMKFEIRAFVSIIGPRKPVSNLTKDDFKKIINHKELTSDHSVANVGRAWNAFLNYCNQKGWTNGKLPKADVDQPQANIPVFIYNDELYQICLYKLEKVWKEIEIGYTRPDNSQLYMPLAWILLRFTGMRPIELQKLYLDAIDITHRQITVGKKYEKSTNRTKTALQRNIEMNRVVTEICRLLKDPDSRSRDRWMKKSDHLFGRPGSVSKKRLSSEFTEARQKILPDRQEVTLYTLRDTFAVSRLTDPHAMSNNPVFEMKKIKDDMGHKDIATTEKYWKAVPPRVHHQRLHNSKLLCKIVQKFYQSSISEEKPS